MGETFDRIIKDRIAGCERSRTTIEEASIVRPETFQLSTTNACERFLHSAARKSMPIRPAHLIRLLKVLRQPTTGFVLPVRAHQVNTTLKLKMISTRHLTGSHLDVTLNSMLRNDPTNDLLRLKRPDSFSIYVFYSRDHWNSLTPFESVHSESVRTCNETTMVEFSYFQVALYRTLRQPTHCYESAISTVHLYRISSCRPNREDILPLGSRIFVPSSPYVRGPYSKKLMLFYGKEKPVFSSGVVVDDDVNKSANMQSHCRTVSTFKDKPMYARGLPLGETRKSAWHRIIECGTTRHPSSANHLGGKRNQPVLMSRETLYSLLCTVSDHLTSMNSEKAVFRTTPPLRAFCETEPLTVSVAPLASEVDTNINRLERHGATSEHKFRQRISRKGSGNERDVK
ncbi:hypothetical protein CLF_106119 [Clonorchis sinensis]|uniref:Uncharacterized protein n=1 Tax=Clonorchis sinensis TaxID=79923 RepID=G7YPN2_CLOSI|nr:hypothetical protein CLF_106119 [Clonorchis sinensis]